VLKLDTKGILHIPVWGNRKKKRLERGETRFYRPSSAQFRHDEMFWSNMIGKNDEV